MQTVLDSNPTAPDGQSRREFLKSLATLAPAVALVPLATALTSVKELTEVPPRGESRVDSDAAPFELLPEAPPPYGPPQRTAIIDEWRARIDQTIIALERFWGYLGEARAVPTVEGVKLYELEVAAQIAMSDLDVILTVIHEDIDIDTLYLAATGRKQYFWCIKRDVLNRDGSREWFETEIKGIGKDDPAAAAELQALLDARYGGDR